MRLWIAAVATLLLATASASDPGRPARGEGILDVPFVPQTEALCGGAAAAMVLRYWGARGIHASDFVSLVEDSLAGIPTGRLVTDLENRGYVALPFEGSEALVRGELQTGRPVIALVESGTRRYHYVVLVAWFHDTILLHDPARGPSRAVPVRAFNAAWAATGNWSLVLLPDSSRTPAEIRAVDGDPVLPVNFANTDSGSAFRPVTLASLLSDGVGLGRTGDLAGAEVRFRAAAEQFPGSAAAWRELAGVRFRQQRWPDAASLAGRATALDPSDTHAWRLLGASRFLQGRPGDALAAWNRVGEPRLDLMRIDGLKRTRFGVVDDRLGLRIDSPLTPRSFRRARRRLADVPAFETCRLDYRPLPGGIVEIDAAVLERPLRPRGAAGAAKLALWALAEKELEISLASPTGSGELWTAAWRFEKNRPRLRVAVSGPGFAGLPGILSVEGFHEQQTYQAALVTESTPAGRTIPQGTDSTASGTILETRRRAGLSWGDWLGADLFIQPTFGFEHWERDDTRFFTAGLGLDLRRFRNAVSLRGQVTRWFPVGGGRPFTLRTVDVLWRSELPGFAHATAEVRAGYRAASVDAPPALWLGAGTGRGRSDLLRAHPLLEGGIVSGPVFGTSLWNGGVEFDYMPWRPGPLTAGFACFVDAARAGGPSAVPGQVDAGIGLRLAGFDPDSELFLDVARGLRDGAVAVSLVYRVRRR